MQSRPVGGEQPMTFARSRVLLVEDDESVRTAVEIAFQGEGFDVMARPDGSEMTEILESFRPDLAILDVRLATGLDGVCITRELRGISDMPILLLTAADTLDDRLAGFRAGADDYIGKPFSMAELLARAESLLRRSNRSGIPPHLGDLVINESSRIVTRAGQAIEFTRTEFDLLATLARRPGQVFSKQQLLTLVWGFEAFADNLVEVHMSAVRRKLETVGPRMIHTVRGIGYILRA